MVVLYSCTHMAAVGVKGREVHDDEINWWKQNYTQVFQVILSYLDVRVTQVWDCTFKLPAIIREQLQLVIYS